jgi:enoyl-CoA hydratase/carnithine racemase
MTQTDKLLSRKEAGVGIVTFNNPERLNAVSLDMWEAAKRALDAFAADNEVRVVVLTGAGGKAFVSGADISKCASERASPEATRTYEVTTAATFDGIYEFPKPTIAMIRGYCVGGGLGLASCCDLRICSDDSRFAVPAAKLGLGYGYAGLKRLVDIVGPSFAKEIFYTARQFDAHPQLCDQRISRQTRPAAVAIGKWMHRDQAVMESNRYFVRRKKRAGMPLLAQTCGADLIRAITGEGA